MKNRDLSELTDDELQQTLTDRWLYRGGLLALLVVFGILLTTLSTRGLSTLPEQIAFGALIACALAAAVVYVVMRQQDHRVYRELRERRRRSRH